MPKRLLAAAFGAATLVVYAPAWAGGFNELPDLGSQAMGRGAAFVAKADDPSALYYNVAGIARQRGTKVELSVNFQLDSYSFARAGRYPDDPKDPATPWGGKPFPIVSNANGPEPIPLVAVTSDFGVFDRLTFGVGLWAPAAAQRTFQLGVNGQPSPARYDYIQSGGAIVLPTIGAGYRVTDWLDVGLAGHLVVANLNQLAVAYTDPGGGGCKNPEYITCDTQATLKANGIGFAASAGVLARPAPFAELGAQVTTPWSATAQGTQSGKLGSGTELPAEPASVTVDFPWIVRLGARYIGLRPREKATPPFEQYDVELDATYEAWSATAQPGPLISTTDPTTNKPTSLSDVHNWGDTFGLRVGGAYNFEVDDAVLSLRAGAFFDSSASASAYTRIDVNTLPKIAGTLGFGYKRGAFGANIAYGGVYSISRTVTDGDFRPSNAGKGGQFVDGNGKPLPAVNNGTYSGFTHVLALGVSVELETLFSGPRKAKFGDPEIEDVEQTPPPGSPRPKRAEKP